MDDLKIGAWLLLFCCAVMVVLVVWRVVVS